ncbi:MAG: hypothetical protein JETCAE02_03540 [Anaerolineaceae bacterium]|nr:MAG: hypothetical protein BroJett001_17500 [Chloroflexota bacterium]GJQ37942.1 MAG: hypothetical protein JETCAE02_03540 [Anaerolineaceae bacterium]
MIRVTDHALATIIDAALAGWLLAAWYGMNTVQRIYARFPPPFP